MAHPNARICLVTDRLVRHSMFWARLRRAALFAAVALGVVLGASGRVAAQSDRSFGLGLIIGDPTGVSMKGFSVAGPRSTAPWASVSWVERACMCMRTISGTSRSNAGTRRLCSVPGCWPELGFHVHRIPHDDHDDVFIGARGPFGLAVMFNAPFDVSWKLRPACG